MKYISTAYCSCQIVFVMLMTCLASSCNPLARDADAVFYAASAKGGPSVTIEFPLANSITGARLFTVSGQAEGEAGISRVEVQIDSGSFREAAGTASWSLDIDGAMLAAGSHTITVRATDNLGQANVAVRGITSDVTAPTVLNQSFAVVGQAGTDTITVIFSEPVYSGSEGSGKLKTANFAFEDESASNAGAFTSMLDADGSDGIIALKTDANLSLADAADRISIADGGIFDAAGNPMAAASRAIGVISGIPPRVIGALTLDCDKNGKIDHYKITLDSDVDDTTFPGYVENSLGSAQSSWLVGGVSEGVRMRHGTDVAVNCAGIASDTPDDNVVYLRFPENADVCGNTSLSGCDTDAMPELTAPSSPGLQDFDPSALLPLNATAITETDGAPPIMVKAYGSPATSSLKMDFSEPIYTSATGGNLAESDFVYTDASSDGATGIAAGTDDGADEIAAFNVSPDFIGDDYQDTVSVAADEVFDLAGNAALAGARQILFGYKILNADSDLYHNCAIKYDGSVVCWGDNTYGQLNAPVLSNPTAVAAGWHHSCAIHHPAGVATVVCWGRNNQGELNVPALTNPTYVEAAREYTCAMHHPASVATVACWGDNTYGQLNAADNLVNPISFSLFDGGGWFLHAPGGTPAVYNSALFENPTHVGAGSALCGVHFPSGVETVTCSGYAGGGYNGIYTSYVNISRLSVANSHFCVLYEPAGTNLVACRGNNASVSASVPVFTNPTQLASGREHACVLHNIQEITCWGNNSYGQLNVP